MGVDAPGSTNTRFGGGAERSGPSRPAALAVALGSTSVLLAASVLGMVLAFAEKFPCRSGAWNSYAKQFQDACYTDIYPLYYNEGLSAGKVPYTGHPVEYPVLIGGAMQAAAWLVRNVSLAIRGREFFDVTVVLLAVCAVAGVLATARAAGPDRRGAGADGGAVPGADPVRVRQLGPDRLRADGAGDRRLGRPPRRVGGRPARPRGRGQVLPAGGLRARCCCSACGPASCASSRRPWPPPCSPGWPSTCR